MENIGLSRRQLETMIRGALDSMKMELPREYSNILIRQGRARDMGSFNNDERDMEAMCDAYGVILIKAVAKVLDSNNKKVMEDVKTLLMKE